MKRSTRIAVLVTVIAVCTILDRITKVLARTRLANRGSGYSFLHDFVRLDYMENRGAFLGLGANWSNELRTLLFTIFVGLAIVAVVAFLAAAKQMRRAEAVALSLIAAGGIGNLIDRLHYGFVTDFLSIGIGPLRTGIFNIADFAITLGVVLLLLPHSKAKNDAAA